MPEQHDREKNCSPNKSMCENLSGRNGGEKFPINRDQAPGRECGDSRDKSGSFVPLRGIRALVPASPSVSGQDRHPRTVATSATVALIVSALDRVATFARPESPATNMQRNLRAACLRWE